MSSGTLFAAFRNMIPLETGLDAWLRYAALPGEVSSNRMPPSNILALDTRADSPVYVAAKELRDGIRGILGRNIDIVSSSVGLTSATIIVGTVKAYASAGQSTDEIMDLKEDGFWLSTKGENVHILGQNERGALYGAFEYLSMLAQGDFSSVAYGTSPSAPIRWVNQWDNLDGSIERGYGGNQFSSRTVLFSTT